MVSSILSETLALAVDRRVSWSADTKSARITQITMTDGGTVWTAGHRTKAPHKPINNSDVIDVTRQAMDISSRRSYGVPSADAP